MSVVLPIFGLKLFIKRVCILTDAFCAYCLQSQPKNSSKQGKSPGDSISRGDAPADERETRATLQRFSGGDVASSNVSLVIIVVRSRLQPQSMLVFTSGDTVSSFQRKSNTPTSHCTHNGPRNHRALRPHRYLSFCSGSAGAAWLLCGARSFRIAHVVAPSAADGILYST